MTASQIQNDIDQGANLLYVSASSATHSACLSKAVAANVPLITLVGMQEACPPTPNPVVFNCRWGASTSMGGRLAQVVHQIAQAKITGATPPLKVIGISADIPSSRRDTQFALDGLKRIGLHNTTLEILPVTMSDYRPIASKIVDAGYQLCIMSVAGPTINGISSALSTLGYKGYFVGSTSGPVPEQLKSLNSTQYYFESPVMTFDLAPDFQAAAKSYGVESNELVQMGWQDGQMVEQYLQAGWLAGYQGQDAQRHV